MRLDLAVAELELARDLLDDGVHVLGIGDPRHPHTRLTLRGREHPPGRGDDGVDAARGELERVDRERDQDESDRRERRGS